MVLLPFPWQIPTLTTYGSRWADPLHFTDGKTEAQ